MILDDFHHILFGKKCSYHVQLYIRTCTYNVCCIHCLQLDGLLWTDMCIVGPFIRVLHALMCST